MKLPAFSLRFDIEHRVEHPQKVIVAAMHYDGKDYVWADLLSESPNMDIHYELALKAFARAIKEKRQ